MWLSGKFRVPASTQPTFNKIACTAYNRVDGTVFSLEWEFFEMATKVNAGDDVKRGNLFGVDPKMLIMKEDVRGRRFAPTEQEVIEMAESLYDNGQEQPIKVRKVEEDRLKVVMGFTRCAAGRLIRDGFTGTDGEHRQNKDFRLQCVICTMNDEDAFRHNVVENAHRKQTSVIDDAYNQQRLRDHCMMKDGEIARLYRYSNQNRVSRLKKFLVMPLKIQMQVHNGELTEEAALNLMELPQEEQEKAIEEATKDGNGKVDSGTVRKIVRDHHLRDDEETVRQLPPPKYPPTESPKFKARTPREVKVYFTGLAEDEEGHEAVRRFSKDFLDFLAGKKTDKAMNNAVQRLLEAKP